MCVGLRRALRRAQRTIGHEHEPQRLERVVAACDVVANRVDDEAEELVVLRSARRVWGKGGQRRARRQGAAEAVARVPRSEAPT
jgi:hypothetical protein